MDIRFAKPADVPGILNLLRQVGQVHHQGRPDLFRNGAQKYGASGILSLMNSPQTPIFTREHFCRASTCGRRGALLNGV